MSDTPNHSPAVRSTPGDGYPQVPDGVSASTPFNWVIALVPLVGLLHALVIELPQPGVGSAAAPISIGASTTILNTPFGILMLGAAAYVATIVLALLDCRSLVLRGFARPFHWEWTFLAGAIYVIGRAVVVRRRGASAFGPMWVYLAILALTVVVSLVRTVETVASF